MNEPSGDIVSGQLDLSDVDLARLDEIDNLVLARALERLRHGIEDPTEAVAGFDSSI